MTKEYNFDNNKQAVDIMCNSFENYPSILKIRSTITAKENANDNKIFLPVYSDKVKACVHYFLSNFYFLIK